MKYPYTNTTHVFSQTDQTLTCSCYIITLIVDKTDIIILNQNSSCLIAEVQGFGNDDVTNMGDITVDDIAYEELTAGSSRGLYLVSLNWVDREKHYAELSRIQLDFYKSSSPALALQVIISKYYYFLGQLYG